MNIEKDTNLGSGNIIQEFNIGTVEQLNPVATTVNNYYGSKDEEVETGKKPEVNARKNPIEQRELAPVREQILLYVSCLSGQVADDWKSRYQKLWDGILDIKEVAAKVYNPGKQQKTTFNRNLVANIIFYLGNHVRAEHVVYKDYNATLFTEKLEADKDHPVRAALGRFPEETIKKSLDRFMETFLL